MAHSYGVQPHLKQPSTTMAHQVLHLCKPSLLTAHSTAVHTAEYATAYNDQTGKLLWTWGNGGPSQPDNSTYSGFNGPYGVYPTQIQSIDNGVVYLATDEHTVTNPIYVGATLAAINATTGQQIWRLSGYPSEWAATGSAWAVAAGYLTFFNGYDGQIYSVGRGPSATTVQAPQTCYHSRNQP